MTESAAIQEILEQIQRLATRFERVETRVADFDSRLAAFEPRIGKLESVLADLDGRIKAWPDMHYLAAAAKAQLGHIREIKSEVADSRIRLDEIYQSMATDPEIRSLRDEVTRFREQSLDVDVRLGALEGRVGVQGPA